MVQALADVFVNCNWSPTWPAALAPGVTARLSCAVVHREPAAACADRLDVVGGGAVVAVPEPLPDGCADAVGAGVVQAASGASGHTSDSGASRWLAGLIPPPPSTAPPDSVS